jgi:hypothetical protein
VRLVALVMSPSIEKDQLMVLLQGVHLSKNQPNLHRFQMFRD